jgi:hypothetical protein
MSSASFFDRYNDADSSSSENSSRSNRRQFLRTMGVAGASLALASSTGLLVKGTTNLVAGGSPTSIPAGFSYHAWMASCQSWLGCVQSFVITVCDGNMQTANWINERLSNSSIDAAPYRRGFHYKYASSHAFSTKIDREEVICGNGFMVDLFPYYGVDCTCPSDYDLNAPEMRRVTNSSEMDFYKCVLAPAGARTDVDQNDHADYEKLRAKYYPRHSPNDWRPVFKRKFADRKGNHYQGYGVEHNSMTDGVKPAGDVLLSPWDI